MTDRCNRASFGMRRSSGELECSCSLLAIKETNAGMESSTALLKTSWWAVPTTGASGVMPGDVSAKSMNSRQEAPGSRSAKFPFLFTRFAMLFLIPRSWLLGDRIVISRWSILALSGADAATLACRVGSDAAYRPRPCNWRQALGVAGLARRILSPFRHTGLWKILPQPSAECQVPVSPDPDTDIVQERIGRDVEIARCRSPPDAA